MNITIRHINHKPSDSLIELLKSELKALLPFLRIDEARVLVEHNSEASPPYRVAFHLVTPGPDIMAETTDHTLRAALLKGARTLRNKIDERHDKRARRREPQHITAGPRRRRKGRCVL